MSNVEQEQRAADAMSAALGTEPRVVRSEDEAALAIAAVLEREDAEKREADNVAHHGDPTPVRPLAEAMVEAPPPPGPVMHPDRPRLQQQVAQATQAAAVAEQALQQAQALRQAGRRHEAADLMARAAETKRIAFAALADAQVRLPVVAQQEAQVSAAQHEAFLEGQRRILQRELGADTPAAIDAVREHMAAAGFTAQELANVTDARAVVGIARALGFGKKRDVSGLRAKSEQWRSRQMPKGSVADEIAAGRLRPGTIETQAELLARGERLSLADQQRIVQARAARLNAPATPGAVAKQQSEAQLLARISRVVR